jgi:two-component system, cell cycle sensor histidine kinase and response regulator CckA
MKTPPLSACDALLDAFPDLVLRVDSAGMVQEVKGARGDVLPVRMPAATGSPLDEVIGAEAGAAVSAAVARAMDRHAVVTAEFSAESNGERRSYEARVVPVGAETELAVIVRDITEQRRSERIRIGQNEIFEMIVAGAPLVDQLQRLAQLLESHLPGARCTVLLADLDSKRLRVAAAPSYPPEYMEALAAGIDIVDGVGSCSTAAARREIVISPDVEQDAAWVPWREFAQRFGIRACCSSPIVTPHSVVVGSVAMHFGVPHQPSSQELHLISVCAHIAAAAIQRKRIEEDLFDSRHMLRTVLDTIPQRVFWKDANCVYVGCNKPLAQDCGYEDPAALVGKTDYDTVSSDIADVYRGDDMYVMKTDQPKLNYEEPQMSGGSELRWLRTSKVPLHDKAGRVIGVLGTYEDITERKNAEQALRQAEEKYRNIVENAVEGIFQSSPDGHILDANPAFARMLGFDTPAELIAAIASFRDQLFLEPEQHDEFVRLLGERGVVQRFETRMLRRDGNEAWVALNVRLVRDQTGAVRHYEGFAEDITERKQLEEQFRQAQKMEAFGQLAGGVAHDFNNILTIIRVSASMLQMEGLDPAERDSAVTETIRAADRAANLTRQLLTFSRRQPLQMQMVDLNEIVRGMKEMVERLIGEHIALETEYADEALIRADAGMMEQTLMNLVVNARDAMPKGGRLLIGTSLATVDAAAAAIQPNTRVGDYVRLTVSDDGVGIAPEHLPHIFEPFFTTKDVGRGTGLGLATVFGIVSQHGGWTEVQSQQGQGATFSVYLPRTPRVETPVVPQPERKQTPHGTETILVAEDEANVRWLLKRMLERHGYRVLVAESGVAALKVWEQRRHDINLLLTDMVMPEGLGGRELAERLVAEKPRLKVIYCSGYTDEVLGPDSPLRNNVNFVEKPFDVEVLLRRVRQCLDS